MGYEYKIVCDGCNRILQEGSEQEEDYFKCEVVRKIEIEKVTGEIKQSNYRHYVLCSLCMGAVLD